MAERTRGEQGPARRQAGESGAQSPEYSTPHLRRNAEESARRPLATAGQRVNTVVGSNQASPTAQQRQLPESEDFPDGGTRRREQMVFTPLEPQVHLAEELSTGSSVERVSSGERTHADDITARRRTSHEVDPDMSYDWVDDTTAKKYECAICLQVQRNPTQTDCGHRFCWTCISTWISKNPPNLAQCPACNATISSTFLDKIAAREIAALLIHCPNAVRGCLAKFALSDLERHMTSCQGLMAMCRFCNQRMLPVMLEVHEISLCEQAPIKCIFEKFGCHVLVIRCQMHQHLDANIQQHLLYIAEALNCLLSSQGLRFDYTADAALTLVAEHQPTGIVLQADRTAAPISSTTSSSYLRNPPALQDDPGTVSSQGRSASLPLESTAGEAGRLQSEGTMTVVNQFSADASRLPKLTQGINSSPAAPSGGSAWLGQLLSTNIARQHHQQIDQLSSNLLEKLSRVEQRLARTEILDQRVVRTEVLDQRMIRTETLEQRMKDSVERSRQQESALHAAFCNGDFIWRIDDFARKRQDAINNVTTVLHSPGFYTRPYGYKLCIRMNPNGVDASVGRHLSLFVHVMKGDYDELLLWPFQGSIELKIMDQSDVPEAVRRHISDTLNTTPTLTAFQKPSSNRNHRGFGYTEFVPLNTINSPQYVKNDVLFVRAIVREANR